MITFDVLSELLPVTANWKGIGIALRLNLDHLMVIEADYRSDPTACLTSMITSWLKGKYNVERFGRPTWRQLVEALGHPAGGANKAFARTIAENHKAGGMLVAMPLSVNMNKCVNTVCLLATSFKYMMPGTCVMHVHILSAMHFS